jgi:UDP-2,4-diacetamido-2,4,6-trideoxy-beta-L-altropyranose hydrolase
LKKNEKQMTLVVRADAFSAIGTGHVMRCIALGIAWKSYGGNVYFASHCKSDQLLSRIEKEGFQFIDIHEPHPNPNDIGTISSLLNDISTSEYRDKTIVVLDGYHFDSHYQKSIKLKGYRLLCIDDYGHAAQYCADVILNQNLSADIGLYPNCPPNTRFLLGPSYALLRKEFITWKNWARVIPNVAKKVLITMGGTDKDNFTLKVIHALNKISIPDLEVAVLLGSTNQYKSEIENALKSSPFSSQLLVSVDNVAEVMAWSDLAIAAGGSTSWELAFMGLPSVLVILAENQRPVSEKLESSGISINLGWQNKVKLDTMAKVIDNIIRDHKVREAMSSRGRSLVNGHGSDEVVRFLIDSHIAFRQAREDDCSLIWEWANEYETRSMSFSSQSISWEEHIRWFAEKMNDPKHVFFVLLTINDEPVGQVRYAIEGREAVVSMSISSKYRGRGFGSQGIRMTCGELFKNNEIDVIRAHIKPGNLKSVKAFTRAGFHKENIMEKELPNNNALSFFIHKDDILS